MTENEAVNKIQWRINTASEIAGRGENGKAFEDLEMAIHALSEIQQYRAMEERLKKVYGECDGLLEVVVSGLERHEDNELPNVIVKSRLLTDEDVDMWDEYRAIGTVEDLKTMKENGAFSGVELAQILAMQKELKKYQSIGTIDEFKNLKDAEEQGLLLRLPCKIGDDVWKIISRSDDFIGYSYKTISRVSFRLDMLKEMGKTAFLTQEEAEQALNMITNTKKIKENKDNYYDSKDER